MVAAVLCRGKDFIVISNLRFAGLCPILTQALEAYDYTAFYIDWMRGLNVFVEGMQLLFYVHNLQK